MKRRKTRMEQIAETNRLENQAGCNHGMPPDDCQEPPKEWFEEQAKKPAVIERDTRWDEASEAEWKASRWGSEGEPE